MGLMGNANVYSILSAKKIRQSIHVLDLKRIAHVPPMRALRELVAQVRQSNVRPVLLKQAINTVLARAVAFGAP